MCTGKDKDLKHFEAREYIGTRAGLAFTALDELRSIILEYSDAPEEIERDVPIIEEMMAALSLLLGVLYPEEMQDA